LQFAVGSLQTVNCKLLTEEDCLGKVIYLGNFEIKKCFHSFDPLSQ